METWQIVVLIGLCSLPIIVLLVGTTLTIILNKEEISKDYERREKEEILNATPYASSDEANKEFLSDSIKFALGYGLYFLISVPLLVKFFGGIKYGPNLPYTVFLIVVGIPFLVCFYHILLKIENRRTRIKASKLMNKPGQQLIAHWIVIVPTLIVFLIMVLLKVSNSLIAK
jgi:hypothetical protein